MRFAICGQKIKEADMVPECWFEFTHEAVVAKSEPKKGWCLAEIRDSSGRPKMVFVHLSEMCTLRLRGATLVPIPANGQAEIPIEDTKILIARINEASSGRYPAAEGWVLEEHLEKMKAASQSAARTLRELAEKRAKKEETRRAVMNAQARRKSGKGNNSGKQKQKA